MQPFRFRAAIALDFRRRQEEAAETVLRRAEADWSTARARWELSRVRVGEANGQLASIARSGADGHVLGWHRNWIAGLQTEVERAGQIAAQMAVAASQARRVWQTARRRRLMLERLRDRALERYRQAESREELKLIDELARARYIASRVDMEGSQE